MSPKRVAVVTANARSLPGQKQFIRLGIFECGVQSNQSERHLCKVGLRFAALRRL